tara:strand:- start:2285 stop:2518 length:234 start_codon:yes stop_codon:yes gene_type:complete
MIIEPIIIIGGSAISLIFLKYWHNMYENEQLKIINYKNQIPPNYNGEGENLLEPSPQYVVETQPPEYKLNNYSTTTS